MVSWLGIKGASTKGSVFASKDRFTTVWQTWLGVSIPGPDKGPFFVEFPCVRRFPPGDLVSPTTKNTPQDKLRTPLQMRSIGPALLNK